MMSMVAELSMRQGQALELQEEVRHYEAELQTCLQNMDDGLIPSDQIHR